jgi:hypothetical protein
MDGEGLTMAWEDGSTTRSPSGVIRVSNCGEGVEGVFLSGPLCGVRSGEEPTRTKAAVRLIVEAREYLRRESDAKSVSA